MTQPTSNITSAYAVINDGLENVSSQKALFEAQLAKLSTLGITPTVLCIDPLSTPWQSEQAPGHFRSGCAPIMALEHATQLIAQGHPAVIIEGEEPLASGYTREQRHQLMMVYSDQPSIAELYTRLATQYMAQHRCDESEFINLVDLVFQNHLSVYQQQSEQNKTHFSLPSSKWFTPVTSLFRGVDCANPLIDFSGKILLCNDEVTQQLNAPSRIQVAGVSLGIIDTDDEPQAIEKIVKYDHLNTAFTQACQQTGIDFVEQFKQGNALLETYTCYPVVPMAFLTRNGFIDSLAQLPEFLSKHQITVTGGMNLARAPWNNPSLNALITMFDQLNTGEKRYGLVHGNGGLGYRQGVAILKSLQ